MIPHEITSHGSLQFVNYVENAIGLTLDYSRKSIYRLDDLVMNLGELSPTQRLDIERQMGAYLGETICRIYGGTWVETDFNGQSFLAVRLPNGGVVSPFSWVQKRFRSGLQDSISAKASAILDELQEPPWNPEHWQQDDQRAEHFSFGLGVSQVAQNDVNKLVNDLALCFETKDPTLVSSLEQLINRLDDRGLKYVWGRLLKLCDVVSAALSYTPSLLEQCLEITSSTGVVYTHHEFVHLTTYLRNASHAVNFYVYPLLWTIERKSKFFKNAVASERTIALFNLLHLYKHRFYFHNIQHYKKLLDFIREDNDEFISALLKSDVDINQECFRAINFIQQYPLRGNLSPFNELQTKAAIITWLDNASGREPKKPWVDKCENLEKVVLQEDIESICNWILENEELKVGIHGWADDVFKRFYKSAKWYFQRTR